MTSVNLIFGVKFVRGKSSEIVKKAGATAGTILRKPIVIILIIAVIALVVFLLYTQTFIISKAFLV